MYSHRIYRWESAKTAIFLENSSTFFRNFSIDNRHMKKNYPKSLIFSIFFTLLKR